MNARGGSRPFRADRGGSTVIEFSIVGSLLILLCFGIIDLGLLFWTRNALQSTADLTARCAAIGSANCTDPQQFAVDTAGAWVFSGIIASSDVTVQANGACNGMSGTFATVTIDCKFWSNGTLALPFRAIPLVVSACYPVSPGA